MNISPEGNYAQAIAQTEQKIAEIDRKLQIVSTQLSQESGETALLSPIEGNIAAIEERNGTYFIPFMQMKNQSSHMQKKQNGTK